MLKNENSIEFNPDLTLAGMAKKMKIPTLYICNQLKEHHYFGSCESAKKALQRKSKLYLSPQDCQNILYAAMREYFNIIKDKPTPARFSVSPVRILSYKNKQRKKAEKIRDNFMKTQENSNAFIKEIYLLSHQPFINGSKFPIEETEEARFL